MTRWRTETLFATIIDCCPVCETWLAADPGPQPWLIDDAGRRHARIVCDGCADAADERAFARLVAERQAEEARR